MKRRLGWCIEGVKAQGPTFDGFGDSLALAYFPITTPAAAAICQHFKMSVFGYPALVQG